MGFFSSKKTKKLSKALIASTTLAAPAAPATPTAPANVGLSQPRTLVRPPTRLKKGEIYTIKYNGNGEDSRKVHVIIEENINLPNDDEAVQSLRDPEEVLPWDVIVIMTTKRLLIYRLEPQKTEEIMQEHANAFWKKAEELLKDDKDPKRFDTMICWFLAAHDREVANLKLHTDMYPIKAEERSKVYSRTFESSAKKTGQYHNFIFEEAHFFLGNGPGPRDQTVCYRSQIVVHDHTTFLGVAEYNKLKQTMRLESYEEIKQNGLLFPMISLMAQDSYNDICNRPCTKTDMAFSRVLWHDDLQSL